MPVVCNGTRFDTFDLMVEENELDPMRARAAFALGYTEYDEEDGFSCEFGFEDPEVESDRVRGAVHLPVRGVPRSR